MVIKKVTFIVLIIFTTQAGIAQKSGVGIKFGLNKSNCFISNTKLGKQKGNNIYTPTFSVFSYSNLSHFLGIQSEVSLYSLAGTNYSDSIYSNVIAGAAKAEIDKLRIHSFSWSPLLVYKFNKNFNALLGPSFDANIRRYFSDDKNESYNHTLAMTYVTDSNQKRMKANIVLGIGGNYKLMRLDLRYIYGLGNLIDTSIHGWNNVYNVSGYTKVKFNIVQLSLAILVPGIEFRKIKKHTY